MGVLDSPMRTAAKVLLGVLGTTGTLHRTTVTYNASTATEARSTVDYTIYVGYPKTELASLGVHLENEDQRMQYEILMSALALDTAGDEVTLTPDLTTDTITFDGKEMQIVKVAALPGSQVAYTLTCVA